VELRRRLEAGGASKRDAARLKSAEALLSTMRSQLNSDPLGWAARVGNVELEDLHFTSMEEAAVSLGDRITQAEEVQRFYGLDKATYLRPEEQKRLAAAMEAGGDSTLATAALIARAAGPKAPDVFAEIAKHSPSMAFLGDLVSRTGLETPIARD